MVRMNMRGSWGRTWWIVAICWSVAACEENSAPQSSDRLPPEHPPVMERGGGGSEIEDLSDAVTVVPEGVRGQWKAVKLLVEDRQEKRFEEYVVALGSTWTVPGSELEVKVGDFLPDLIINGKVFTSATDELKNPAVHVMISEDGRELFKGWLFSLFPGMHPFRHERFAITLKDAVQT